MKTNLYLHKELDCSKKSKIGYREKYSVRQMSYELSRSIIDKVAGIVGYPINKGGTMLGGEYSWGIGRVWIQPNEVNVGGVIRDNFSIHGGGTPGSAGCIDLTNKRPLQKQAMLISKS